MAILDGISDTDRFIERFLGRTTLFLFDYCYYSVPGNFYPVLRICLKQEIVLKVSTLRRSMFCSGSVLYGWIELTFARYLEQRRQRLMFIFITVADSMGNEVGSVHYLKIVGCLVSVVFVQ